MKRSRGRNISVTAMQSTLNYCSKMENLQRKYNFASVFWPIYYFSRVFSFMPFTIVYDSMGEVREPKVTVLDMLWFLISLCAYLVAITGGSYSFNKLSKLNTQVNTIYYTSEFTFGIIGMIRDMRNRYKLIDILQTFIQFDKEVKIINIVVFELISQSLCSPNM